VQKRSRRFLSGPGATNLKNPPTRRVFAFGEPGLFIELRSIHSSHPCDSPCGQRDALCKNAPIVSLLAIPPLLR
ncbi:hypothetical protein QBS63_18170, partial [Cronobacter sakazakii]|nr:hypothetical protein [Cronobacter sakazakii]